MNLADPEAFEEQVFDDRASIDYRAEVAHRIMKVRLDEVFESQKSWAREMEFDETAVVEALCCASLVGGVSVSAFEVFKKVSVSKLEKWVVRGHDTTALLPPVGSWPISEAFIERSLDDYSQSLTFRTLVRRALAIDAGGLARQLTRRGRLARRLLEEVARLEGDAEAGAPFALNLFEVAATRAIWADREAVPRALAAIEQLPTADLAQAQSDLEALGACYGSVPDVLVAALLLTALGSRRFSHTWDWDAWETFHPLWTRWMNRFGWDLGFAPPMLREPMLAAGIKLYEAFFVAVDKLNDPARAFELLADSLGRAPHRVLSESIPLPDETSVHSWSAVFRHLFVLDGMCLDRHAISANPEVARLRFEMIARGVKDHIPARAKMRECAYVETSILSRKITLEVNAGAYGDLETIGAKIAVLTQYFMDYQLFARFRLFSIGNILRGFHKTKGDADVAWAQAEEAEAFCKPFLSDEECLVWLVWCWAYALARSRVESDEAFDVVMARLRGYGRAFPNSESVQAPLVQALQLRIAALVALEDNDMTDVRLFDLTSRIEVAAQERPDLGDVQWVHATAWDTLALRWMFDSKRGLRIGAIARNADEFTRPFPDHADLQFFRLSIWRSLAFYESRYGVHPDEAERIARRITWAAKRFNGHEAISASVAHAWEAAVFGWHRDLRAWPSCERALRRLEAWLAENRAGYDGIIAQVSAWGSLLAVHRERRDFDAFARFEPGALDRAEAARRAYPADQKIAEAAGYIFTEVAGCRREHTTDRTVVEDMAARMHALTAVFQRSENLRKNAAHVDGLLRGLPANTPLA